MFDKKSTLGSRFLEAMSLTIDLHGKDVRKGTSVPYLAHLLAVCSLVLYDGGSKDEAIAAFLHDALEEKSHLITRQGIASRFGDHVLEIVDVSTDTPKDYAGGPKPPWRERKECYLKNVRETDPVLLRVTIADKVDNARSMLADYDRVGDKLWTRFNASYKEIIWYYTACVEVYEKVGASPTLLKALYPLVNRLRQLPVASRYR